MTKGKVILAAIAAVAIVGGALAFKTRQASVFYSLDTNPNPAQRKCTVETLLNFTTVEADKIPGAPTLTTTAFYSTSALTSICPTITYWSAQ